MPFQPFQPNYQSTPTPTPHLPLASSSRTSVQCWEDDDYGDNSVNNNNSSNDKENKPRMKAKGGKTRIETCKKKTPSKLSRRNERERNRVHLLNQGFDRLRAVVPKREGEYLSKISTLKKAIWYIEHLDRVLKEECVGVEGGEQSVGDSGVVGTDLDSGGTGMETQSLATSRREEGVGGRGVEEVERLSPIFPPRMEEVDPAKPLPFSSSKSQLDSGYLSGGLQTPGRFGSYPAPPPVRVWTLDFDAASTPNR
nr:achaete scute transcription factor [Hymenolepis microstoma]